MAPHLQPARAPGKTHETADEASIQVVLADDHALMRRTLRLLLDGADGVEVIAEADDLEGVTRNVLGHEPHVLVLDLHMPGGSSIEAIGRLRERAPATNIVVVTMEENPVFAQRAFAAGALGFVAKDRADGELPDAVRAAASGREFVSPQVALRLDALHRSLTDDVLSPREVEVLRLIALGTRASRSPASFISHRVRSRATGRIFTASSASPRALNLSATPYDADCSVSEST